MNCLRLLRLAERHTISVWKSSSPRLISNHPIKFLEAQNRWRDHDNVSQRWQLIYKAPMDKALNYLTTYITVSTTAITLSSLYYLSFVFNLEEIDKPVILGEDVVIANNAAECLIYVGAFIVFHVALKVLLSKYVIRLYQDGDDYLAIFRGSMYNSINKHQFKLKDFKKLSPTFIVSWSDARFGLGDKHAIILENYFKTPEYFNYLLYKKSRYNPNDEE